MLPDLLAAAGERQGWNVSQLLSLRSETGSYIPVVSAQMFFVHTLSDLLCDELSM